MAQRNWTAPQQNAIDARGGPLLVSAAAGSGKTAVLVERVVGLICDQDHPVDVDRLLIVTFSNAAAAEMRQRVGARLTSMIQRDPLNSHLQRQHALLQKAQISTIHSFCLSVVRDHFQHLEISPDFTIADENEMELLMGECVSACVERRYGNDETGAFSQLVELLSAGRDDTRLIETVYKIYDFSRSHPFYEDWLDEKAARYRAALPVKETDWGKILLAYAVETLEHCVSSLGSGVSRLGESDDKLRAAYLPAFDSDLRQAESCLALAKAGNWDGLAEALSSCAFPNLKPVRGEDPDKEALKALRARCKDAVKGLGEKYFCATEEEARADLADLAPKIAVLFDLVKEFGRELWTAKSAKKRLDFSDLEHLTLTLVAKKELGRYLPTEHGARISQRYDYILIDEYQDTNEVQDTIFTCVSRGQANLFFVGDVKQSIYSFRQAMPEIFLARRRASFPYDGMQYPAAIDLDTNFRSRLEVTEAVNFVFGRIMSSRVGEIDYDQRESLKQGARYPQWDRANPELLLLGLKEYAGDKDAATLEADAVAQRIAGLLESGYQVADGGELRPAAPRDICILLRSPKSKAKTYVDALARRGVAAWSDSAGGFLAAREVSMVLSLLKALDNPLLDVELAAAMLSPLFGFTDDELAEIRLLGRTGPLFTALTASSEGGNAKAGAFLARFAALRRDSDSLSADRLILRVYRQTRALEIARAMPMGESRRANLLLLIEYAEQYHAMGYKRLAGFVGFLSRLEERGGDLEAANSLSDGANVVRIMSIHRSKGLEFPVVILADTAKQFNLEDLRAPTILHSRYGFACVRRDRESFRQYPTVPMQAIRLEARRSMLSEEMRILYVAMTRAREKLIVSSAIRGNLMNKLKGLDGDMEGGRLHPHLVEEAKSFSDWILMSLLRHASGAALRERANCSNRHLLDDGIPWDVELREDFPEQTGEAAEAAPAPTAKPDPALLAEFRRRADWTYPFDAHTRIPAKLAVSSVAKGKHDVSRRFAARPAFLTGQGLTPAERGNAMHKFMQFADYDRARKDLAEEIRRMGERAYLSPLEAESLSMRKLAGFFDSPLAERMFASDTVYRELKFMAEFGKEELGEAIEGMDGEARVVLNGVADCVFLEADGAVIVDYKTDAVKTGEELLERYRVQLELYGRILSRSLGVAVKELALYSFSLNEAVILPNLTNS